MELTKKDIQEARLDALLLRVRSMKERAKDLLDKSERLKNGFVEFVQEVQNDTQAQNKAV
jgi:hypothetical protein